MSLPGGAWDDLSVRLASGAAMGGAGLLAVWLGGPWFAGLVAIAAGVMVWELARMVAPGKAAAAVALGVLAAAVVVAARLAAPGPVAVALLAVPAVLGAAWLRRMPAHFAVFAFLLLVAGFGLVGFRAEHGVVWLFWLVLVVIATDVFGYFVGRSVGGPKFFPRISPKKTWSGTVAGWLAAAAVGGIFLTFTTAGRDLPLISAGLALASQIGDIAESALKRRAGVKDSSTLLPGHGGLFDRFDGLLGAALLMLLVAQLTPVPVVRV